MTPRPPSMAALVLLATNYIPSVVSINSLLRLLHLFQQQNGWTHVIILLEDNSPLRVSHKCPCNARFLQLIHANLSCKSAIWFIEDVLGGNFDAFTEMFAGEEKVEGRWRNDDLYII